MMLESFVISSCNYRKGLTKHFLNAIEDGEPMIINIYKALHLIRDSRRCVKKETIRNYWCHMSILPSRDDDRSTTYINEEETLIAKIMNLEIDNEHCIDVHKWLSTNKKLETRESLTDEDILTIISKLPVHKNRDRNDT